MDTKIVETPLGNLKLEATTEALVSVKFSNEIAENNIVSNKIIQATEQQLNEFFAGKRKIFNVPLTPQGTEFQKKVWNELLKIPYSQTLSYGQIAKNIGNEKASRAVGLANNKNPIVILIPCHRVIGANGLLTGYGGGLWRKEWLLNLEKENA